MPFDNRFIEYLETAIGRSNAETALEHLSAGPSVSVRLNPFKVEGGNPDSIFENVSGPVLWNDFGYFLQSRPKFTLDPCIHAGCYYVQDSSAMFPGYALRSVLKKFEGLDRPLRVLDLCASPGGKTTDFATSLRKFYDGRYILISNEIMKQRATVLADNAGLWGDPCTVVVSADPVAFAAMEGYFDIIAADVPCSGEGMFRKDEEAVSQWSESNVALCQSRQRRIVADVWPALAPGGVFIYSTCTFNKFENDDNACWIASGLGAEKENIKVDFKGIIETDWGYSLVPGLIPGEGQYCSVLRKNGCQAVSERSCRGRMVSDENIPKETAGRIKGFFSEEVRLLSKGGMLVAVPECISSEVDKFEYLRPLLRGVAIGQLKGKDLVPDEDLALSLILKRGVFPEYEVDMETALKFLHKDAFTLPDAERGFVMITYRNHPLGFVKNLGNRCNNLHPGNRRIKMDIQ